MDLTVLAKRRANELAALLASGCERIGITGAPGTGKSTLSETITGLPVVHADDVLALPDGTKRAWDDIGPAVCELCPSGKLLVEGTEVPQAVRSGLRLDLLYVLTEPCEHQEPAHLHLWASMLTVLKQVTESNPGLRIIYEGDSQNASNSVITLDSSNWEDTPQGGIKLKSVELSKADVFAYARNGAVVYEYRSPDGLKDPAAIASLEGATVTLSGHTFVTPTNFKPLVVGHVQNVQWDESRQALIGDVIINDGETVEKIKRGELCEVSCGYANRYVAKLGKSPSGKTFERIQTEFVFNHLALGPAGWSRQGTVFTLDADDTTCPSGEENTMFKAAQKSNASADAPATAPVSELKPEEKKPEASADAPVTPPAPDAAPAAAAAPDPAVIQQLVAAFPEIQAMLADYRVYKEAQAQETAGEQLQVPEVKTIDAKDVDALVAETVALHTEASKVLGAEYVTTGKSKRQILTDVVLSADSKFTVPADDSALEAAYRMSLAVLSERAQHKQGGADRMRSQLVTVTTDSNGEPPRAPVMDRVYESNRRKKRAS